jgi:DNA-directed RNA polymerase specialized sigma24 family protein
MITDRALFFDQSQRPVRTADFDYGALDPSQEPDQQLKDRLAVSEYFRQRYEWILAGRTRQSRRIRQAIVQASIDGTSLATIAKRFGVTRQAVYDQAKTAPKLDAIFHR